MMVLRLQICPAPLSAGGTMSLARSFWKCYGDVKIEGGQIKQFLSQKTEAVLTSITHC